MTILSKWAMRAAIMTLTGLLSVAGYAADGDSSGQSAIDQILAKAAAEKQSSAPANSGASSASTPVLTPRQQLVRKELQKAKTVDSTPAELTDESAHYDLYPGDLKQISEKAFANIVRNTTPMTPDQIRLLHLMLDKTKRATSESPGVPPKATSSSVQVNMAPGAAPPVIRLRNGYVTSVVFIDATGQPWPIAAYDLGNSKLFNIHWDQKGNTLMIQSNTDYQQGNLAVILRGMNAPVMITLIPGQQAVDYRLDMRIPRLGPNALSTNTSLPSTGDPRLLNVLDGIAPTGAKQLQLSMVGSEAWVQGNVMFLRTPLAVLSPSWTATVRSDDGMHAYEMQPAPVILVMQHGKISKLTVKGF
ncbi:MAG: DotH/IcmK family type IV secretion protein [Coxiellaceae bacterium]|nr:DotH/IcmK family type IV secretion protein [Coxiellaceae bacterium]